MHFYIIAGQVETLAEVRGKNLSLLFLMNYIKFM
jgi:hypothetical protein